MQTFSPFEQKKGHIRRPMCNITLHHVIAPYNKKIYKKEIFRIFPILKVFLWNFFNER